MNVFFQFSIVESREKFKSLEEYIYMQKININWLFKEEENSTDNHKGKVLKTYKIIWRIYMKTLKAVKNLSNKSIKDRQTFNTYYFIIQQALIINIYTSRVLNLFITIETFWIIILLFLLYRYYS